MKVAIHQPEFIPWLGFFHKMFLADIFVIFDTVQFEKNNFQNRNQIIMGGTKNWLTIPVKKHSLDTAIKDIEINWESGKVAKKHLKTIKNNYSKSEYFYDLFPFLEELYLKKIKFLADFNIEMIKYLAEKLGIETKLLRSSEMELSPEAKNGTEKTLNICKQLNAQTYISGSGGKNYLDTDRYERENIKIFFQDYKHPNYKQLGLSIFISHLSIIDLYFNNGKKSLEILLSNNI